MKFFILCSVFLSISCVSFCQKKSHNTSSKDSFPVIKIKNEARFYVNIQGGYATSLGSTFRFYPDNITSISIKKPYNAPVEKLVNYKEESKGLGSGARIGVGFSYIVNDFINAGIDVDYFRSSIGKTKDSSFYSSTKSGANIKELIYDEQYNISYETTLLLFSPNITLKAIIRPKFFIYTKLGAIIILWPSSIQHETVDGHLQLGLQGYYKDSSIFKQKTYKWGIQNPAFGFTGAVGGQVKITEQIRIFSELQFTHINLKTQNTRLTNYTINGVDNLSSLNQSQKETVFKKSYESGTTAANPDMPSVGVYQKFPITYAGLQVGVVYNF